MSAESHKPPPFKEVAHKHKVLQINGTATKVEDQPSKGLSKENPGPEKYLSSRLSNMQVTSEQTNRKILSESIFGRASKWLEATNSAFDKKFCPIATSTAVTSNSFQRARNAFVNRNSLAERKLVFTRVQLAEDMEQALPGFKWRVVPNTTVTCEQKTNNGP